MCSRFLTIALIAIIGCASNAPAEKLPAKPDAGSEHTAWAEQHEGTAIRGLDGAWYDRYKRSTIERTQRALRDRGLYSGPINGILDPPTMQAIYEFQKASYRLQMCGVPTPRTRVMLDQGSHTDPESPTRSTR